MIRPTPAACRQPKLFIGATLALLLGLSQGAFAQGLVKGMQDGAEAGNKAAGPVGGVLGGAIGGVVGVFSGALGVNDKPQGQQQPQQQQQQPAANAAAPARPAAPEQKAATKTAKALRDTCYRHRHCQADRGFDAARRTVLTAEQIVANSDSYIDRIKSELNLTPVQEKNWSAFNSAMHYLGHNGAERLNLRIARAKRDPPDDIVEQMRNEAQFLVDRAADQRAVADAAEPLFVSLNDKQRTTFIEEMVRLSHERGLD